MGLMNTINELAKAHGIKNAYQFAKRLEGAVPVSTARRLYQRREVYPDKKAVLAICKVFNAQPGDFLVYQPDNSEAA